MMKARSENGAAAVEFAVILPLLILLVAGIVEFSLLYLNKQILATASREGARIGIVADTTDSDIREMVRKVCREEYDNGSLLTNFLPLLETFGTSIVDLPDANIIIIRSGTGSFQDDLTVEVRHEYQFLFPKILGLGTTKWISVKTIMKIEDDPTP